MEQSYKIASRKKITKRAVTLIEMMIVIVLIGIIMGAIAYNYQGSLEAGRAFKTEQTINKLQNILMIELANSQNVDYDAEHWQTILLPKSPLVRNPAELLNDGWGRPFQVSWQEENGQKIPVVTSLALNSYNQKRANTHSP